MQNAVIIDAVRTPSGGRNGGLSRWHPADLVAELLQALQRRNDLDPALVEDVIVGCMMQVGAQSLNVGRNAVLAAGWPESVPATTVDRQCGSSQQAVHFAAQGVMAGAYDVVVAAGVEVMSMVPMGASVSQHAGEPFGPTMARRYEDRGGLVPQGLSAELVAERWGLGREELDAYALRSQSRAARAAQEGRFTDEIVGIPVRGERSGRSAGGRVLDLDETLRPMSLDALAELKPICKPGGVVTAGNSAPICDGAAAVLIMSEACAERLGLRPRARFVRFDVTGSDPLLALTGPIDATRRVLERAAMALERIDRIEINEPFAPAVLAWARELRPDMDRVNVNGGAIALGHPAGASGARLLTTLLYELERSAGRYGLQTMSGAGGLANAAIIERLG